MKTQIGSAKHIYLIKRTYITCDRCFQHTGISVENCFRIPAYMKLYSDFDEGNLWLTCVERLLLHSVYIICKYYVHIYVLYFRTNFAFTTKTYFFQNVHQQYARISNNV